MANHHVWIILLAIVSSGIVSSASAQVNQDSEFEIDDPLYIGTFGMESYSVHLDDETYRIYYEFIRDYNNDNTFVILSSISVDLEKKSLVLNVENIQETKYLDVLIPNKLLTAQDNKFSLFIDGVEKGYEVDVFPEHTALGLIVPANSHIVEIIGTHIVPEFGSVVAMVLIVGIASIIIITRKNMFSLVQNRKRLN